MCTWTAPGGWKNFSVCDSNSQINVKNEWMLLGKTIAFTELFSFPIRVMLCICSDVLKRNANRGNDKCIWVEDWVSRFMFFVHLFRVVYVDLTYLYTFLVFEHVYENRSFWRKWFMESISEIFTGWKLFATGTGIFSTVLFSSPAEKFLSHWIGTSVQKKIHDALHAMLPKIAKYIILEDWVLSLYTSYRDQSSHQNRGRSHERGQLKVRTKSPCPGTTHAKLCFKYDGVFDLHGNLLSKFKNNKLLLKHNSYGVECYLQCTIQTSDKKAADQDDFQNIFMGELTNGNANFAPLWSTQSAVLRTFQFQYQTGVDSTDEGSKFRIYKEANGDSFSKVTSALKAQNGLNMQWLDE